MSSQVSVVVLEFEHIESVALMLNIAFRDGAAN